MSRKWHHYLNRQLYSECQLISALNAYYFFTGVTFNQNSAEYEKLVDLVKARYGAAIGIEKVHRELKLKVLEKHEHLWEFTDIKPPNLQPHDFWDFKGKIPLPIEVYVWHPKAGYHSALIVDQCLKSNALRIANFSQVTSSAGWILKENFYPYESKFTPDHSKQRYRLWGFEGKND